jgi:hypothetical protein
MDQAAQGGVAAALLEAAPRHCLPRRCGAPAAGPPANRQQPPFYGTHQRCPPSSREASFAPRPPSLLQFQESRSPFQLLIVSWLVCRDEVVSGDPGETAAIPNPE